MPNIRLQVVPEPARGTRTVLRGNGPDMKDSPIMIGEDGDTNLLCGACGQVLAKNIDEGDLANVVLRCTHCEAHNDVPA